MEDNCLDENKNQLIKIHVTTVFDARGYIIPNKWFTINS